MAGDGWLAVGDAGGLVDPITGEGLYYAMRSGDLASQVVIDDAHWLAEKAPAYRGLLRRDFAPIWNSPPCSPNACSWATSCSAPCRAHGRFMRRSPRFRVLMQDLFAGTQPYLDLKSRLLRNLNGTHAGSVHESSS